MRMSPTVATPARVVANGQRLTQAFYSCDRAASWPAAVRLRFCVE